MHLSDSHIKIVLNLLMVIHVNVGYTGMQCETGRFSILCPLLSTACCKMTFLMEAIKFHSKVLGIIANITLSDINECRTEPCQHNSTCFDMIHGFLCTCASGLTGLLCESGEYMICYVCEYILHCNNVLHRIY